MKEYCKCFIRHNVDMASVPNWRKYLILLARSLCDTISNNIELKYCPWCGKKLPKSP